MEAQLNEIEINGITYVKKTEINSKPIGEKRIIVADRGWVFVGDCTDNDDKSVTIYNAKNIRRWGTKEGLGELVYGPLESTIYDNYGTVRCIPIISIGVFGGW